MIARFETPLRRLAESSYDQPEPSQESRHALAMVMLADGELFSTIRDTTGLTTSRIYNVRARFIHWGLPGLRVTTPNYRVKTRIHSPLHAAHPVASAS